VVTTMMTMRSWETSPFAEMEIMTVGIGATALLARLGWEMWLTYYGTCLHFCVFVNVLASFSRSCFMFMV
jgi:hypothetical protein